MDDAERLADDRDLEELVRLERQVLRCVCLDVQPRPIQALLEVVEVLVGARIALVVVRGAEQRVFPILRRGVTQFDDFIGDGHRLLDVLRTHVFGVRVHRVDAGNNGEDTRILHGVDVDLAAAVEGEVAADAVGHRNPVVLLVRRIQHAAVQDGIGVDGVLVVFVESLDGFQLLDVHDFAVARLRPVIPVLVLVPLLFVVLHFALVFLIRLGVEVALRAKILRARTRFLRARRLGRIPVRIAPVTPAVDNAVPVFIGDSAHGKDAHPDFAEVLVAALIQVVEVELRLDRADGHGHGAAEPADPTALIIAEMERYKPAIRDAVISVLSNKTSDELATPTGKEIAKEEILEMVNNIFEGQREVMRVSFGQFIIQ